MSIGTAFSIRIGAPEHCSTWTKQIQILCAIYRKLNVAINTTMFTSALAQTCWTLKENKGTLITA